MSPIRLKTPPKSNKQVQEYVSAVQSGMNAHFVVKSSNGWSVKRVNAKKSSGIFATKQEAVAKARSIARNQGTGVYVFAADGHLSDKFAY